MAGTFDDIIRRVLGMQPSVPDEAAPFGGSQLGPMIEDWLGQRDPPQPIAEDELSPYTDLQLQTHELTGGPRKLLYQPGPGRDMLNNSAPMIIPNNPAVPERGPNTPLQRGNAKRGAGLDV